MTEFTHFPLHYFKYNIHEMCVLERFNTSQFSKDVQGELAALKYKEVEGNSLYTLYESAETEARYLLVLSIDGYGFFFYIKDDDSLIAWKKQYTFVMKQQLLQAFLPEQPALPEYIKVPMNVKTGFLAKPTY